MVCDCNTFYCEKWVAGECTCDGVCECVPVDLTNYWQCTCYQKWDAYEKTDSAVWDIPWWSHLICDCDSLYDSGCQCDVVSDQHCDCETVKEMSCTCDDVKTRKSDKKDDLRCTQIVCLCDQVY